MNERMFYPPQAGKILLLLRVRNARFRVVNYFTPGRKLDRQKTNRGISATSIQF